MDGAPELFKTRFATVVAMTHIQLPFTLLPIYSVMKTISPTYMRAAKSLGGTPFYSFIRVYMPQTLPGVAAGCLLTFILCLGYYITPALVGGPTDQMVSGFIDARHQHREQLGQGLGAGRHPAHRHADPLLRLQQAGRHRPHEAGLSAMAVPSYFTTGEKIAHYSLRVFVALVLLFLISPIIAVMPLSFNSESFFTYPMPGYSLKWYEDFFFNDRWTGAVKMSFFIAIAPPSSPPSSARWRPSASRAPTSPRRRRSWRS